MPEQQSGASGGASINSAVTLDGAALEWELRSRLAGSPGDIAALERLAGLLARQGRVSEAADTLQRLLKLAPDAHATRLTLSNMLMQNGDFEGALSQLKNLRPPLRSSFEVRTSEAGLLGMLGRHSEQIELYKKLLRQYPADPRLWERLGHPLKYSGRTAEAVRAFRQAVKLNSAYGEGWWALANVKTFRFEPTDEAAMRDGLSRASGPQDAGPLNFALGKALEDRGDYEGSFRHYAEGNRIRAGEFPPEQMSTARLRTYVEETVATFDEGLFRRFDEVGYDAADAIFVVGLQRSGSTLVEQILASHPQIEGVAEPDAMMHVWTALDASAGRSGKTIWAVLSELKPDELRAIGADYLDRVRPFRKEGTPLFVDKRPANWMYVGLIRLALPRAKIIDARRHPMACGFSNFKQHYAAGNFPFAYKLETIGEYYAAYLKLMEHFDRVQPGAVHHVLNERLIGDPEGEIRRLLDFVGVPFDAACLDFHKTKRAVTTASAEQVRRPINREGVDQWRNYEPWLGPLKEALGDALHNWDKVGDSARTSPPAS